MHIFLGFDFYGAGNIGDDLMLAGFLTLVPQSGRLTCVLPRDPGAQARRFPRITWVQGGPAQRARAIRECDLWVGVGATPFSTVHRAWLLRHMEQDLRWCRRFDKAMALVGVDAEQDLLHSDYRDLAVGILGQCRAVLTRDRDSVAILQALGAGTDVALFPGIDLAHLYLGQGTAVGAAPGAAARVGVCYWEETFERELLRDLRVALRGLRCQGKSITFFANEVRREFDYRMYRRITTLRDRVRWPHPMRFYRPDFEAGALDDLIAHYATYDTVVSSRYHALVVAAWMGCRVLALGRRTKVLRLAQTLGITRVCPPWDDDRRADPLLGAAACRRAVQRLYRDTREPMASSMDKILQFAGGDD